MMGILLEVKFLFNLPSMTKNPFHSGIRQSDQFFSAVV
jgi:hypothetical protein